MGRHWTRWICFITVGSYLARNTALLSNSAFSSRLAGFEATEEEPQLLYLSRTSIGRHERQVLSDPRSKAPILIFLDDKSWCWWRRVSKSVMKLSDITQFVRCLKDWHLTFNTIITKQSKQALGICLLHGTMLYQWWWSKHSAEAVNTPGQQAYSFHALLQLISGNVIADNFKDVGIVPSLYVPAMLRASQLVSR